MAGAGIYTFFYFKKRSRAMRHFLDRTALRTPIIGPILQKTSIARYARTLSTMFAAGVPLVEAMDSVAGAVGNIVYGDAIRKMQPSPQKNVNCCSARKRCSSLGRSTKPSMRL